MPAPRMGFHIRGGDKLSEDVQLVSVLMLLLEFVPTVRGRFGILHQFRHLGKTYKSGLVQSRMTTRPEDFVTNLAEAFPDLKVRVCSSEELLAFSSPVALQARQ